MAQQQTSSTAWALIAASCLVLGLALGYVMFRGQPAGEGAAAPGGQETAAQARPAVGVVDEQAAAALKNILAADPDNVQANTRLGNLLFDAGRYSEAVGPYRRAFARDPRNVNLSTDLGTSLWYSGQPDAAISQFEQSLAIEPNHPQTLFNLGIVRRDGKRDPAGAIRAWEQLLAANPAYAERDKVRQQIELARQQLASTRAAPAGPRR
jgi:cytochrome c-type biogenesis protein CcmH/NrfG